jgi:PAS domain S-box-containing protein
MERASGSPKRLSRWTLRRAFAAFMATLVLIVLGFAFVFGASLLERGRTEAISKAAALEQYVRRSLEVSTAIAEDALRFLHRRETLDGLARDMQAHSYFARLASSLGLGIGMVFVDDAGRVVLHSASFPATQVDLSDRGWFQAHLAGADRAIDGAFISRVAQGLIFVHTFAMRDAEGRFLGAVNIGIPSDQILGARALPFDDTGIVTAVAKETGEVLARDPFPEALIGTSLELPAHAREEWVGLRTRLADGRRAVTAYRPMPEYGLVTSVSIPLVAVLQPLIVVALASLPLLALVFLAGLFTLRHLETQQRKLRQTATRLETVLHASSLGAWQWSPKTGRNEYNDRWAEMLGYQPGEIDYTHDEWRRLLHPDDAERVLESVARNLRGETEEFREEHRLRHKDGHWVWVLDSGRVVERDAEGNPELMTGVHLDITERREAEERRLAISREVDHRAKNLLAVVRAIVSMTRAESVEAFKATLRGRILALSHAHELLSEGRWEGADLRDIAEQELAPYRRTAGRVVEIEGPRVVLAPSAIQSLSMALHELATNAAKYGALSQPSGRLRLRWQLPSDASAIRIDWEESGVDGVAEPDRAGFGTEMIRMMIETQLGGTLDYEWTEGGMRCTITVPRGHVTVTPVTLPAHAKDRRKGPPRPEPLAVHGRRLLLVEDEALVGAEMEAQLKAAGYDVAHSAATQAQAIALAERADVDGAVLDINLGGSLSFPAADALAARGIPFVFMTGYRYQEVIPCRFKDVPVVAKPCASGALEQALAREMPASHLAAANQENS